MAQFKFRHGVMGSGKSQSLLIIWYQYTKGDLLDESVLVLTPKTDDRHGVGKVTSRDGKQIPAQVISEETPVSYYLDNIHLFPKVECVLIDEVQFLPKEDIYKLKDFARIHDLPVFAFGLLKDFQNRLFEGSEACLVVAEDVQEIDAICEFCRDKAIMNLRIDSDGAAIRTGDQIEVGGDDRYVSVCHSHWLDPKA